MIHPAEYDDCRPAIEKAFKLFPLDVTGKTVMVKPNALRGNAPEEAVTTHPAVLRAVIEKLEEMNPADIIVGDNPGMANYGINEDTFEKTGLLEASGKYFQNIGRDVAEVEPAGDFFQKVSVSRAILDADIYISLPKFKTHGLTILSGAIKNNYGILPGAQKARGHRLAGNPWQFNELVVDIFGIRIPDLIIVDAVLGMEGNGPISKETRHVGKILAADNAVAVDATISRMMGFDPTALRFLRVAKKRGYGDYEAKQIEIIGELKPVPGFKLPPAVDEKINGMPASTTRLVERLTRMRPRADHSLCTGCGTCVDECPAEALVMREDYPEVDPDKCIVCFCCQEKCPERAIELR
jgi:uncharacterized protein (DUF362 family)/Pyruvate/2-oxoacid:ferredoxin oxidoreductase delta subunit